MVKRGLRPGLDSTALLPETLHLTVASGMPCLLPAALMDLPHLKNYNKTIFHLLL